MLFDGIINVGALVEFSRKSPSGNDILTTGWVTNVVDKDEYNCSHTYLVIEYYGGRNVEIHHAKEQEVKLITKNKEKK